MEYQIWSYGNSFILFWVVHINFSYIFLSSRYLHLMSIYEILLANCYQFSQAEKQLPIKVVTIVTVNNI